MDKKRNRRVNFGSLDVGGKLPPQEIDLELAVLGVLLIEKESFEKVCDILKKECFYKDNHGIVYNAIAELHKKRESVDILTVTAYLKKSGELDIVGGAYAITQLTNGVTSSAHVEYHARLIVEAYLSREIIRISGEFQSRAFDNDQDVFEVLDEYFKEIDAIRNYGVDGEGEVPLAVSIEERVKEKEEMVRNKIEITGISTGNPKLDNLISGFNNGCVYVIAAAPSQGKSVKGLNYAKIAALQSNRVPVFSLEMSKRDYIDRFICEESKVPLGDYRANRITEYDMQKIKIAAKQLKSLPISIYDNPSANTNYIRKKLKLEIKKHGKIGLAVIDYAQLLKPNERSSSREQEVSNAVKDLKVIAKEFDIPVILLAQVGRDIYKAADRRPNLSMIRESAEIENSADFVSFIYRPSFYYDLDSHPDRNDMNSKIATIDQLEYDLLSELIVVKNRAGLPNVIIYEKFYGQFSCFTTDSIYNTTTPFIDESENSDINPAPF